MRELSQLGGFKDLNTPAKTLIVNTFFLTFGVTLVIPFLAIYLTKDLRVAPALVGAIIGVRTLTQQGMFLIGGALADKVGPRPIIILGCALRAISFLIFALWTSVPAIVLATIFAGLGAALFGPAVRAYLMAESAGHRAEAFGLLNIAGNFGALVGPLAGGLLLAVNFQVVAGAAAAMYLLLTVLQMFTLPARERPPAAGNFWKNWQAMVRSKPFRIFTVSGAIYALLAGQLAFGLVVEGDRITGRSDAVTVIYLASTLITMFLQVKVMRWFRNRWDSAQCLAIGTTLAAVGWLPIGIAAPLLTTQHSPLPLLEALWVMTPLLAGTMIMALGSVIALPFQMELMAVVGSERLIGTYYGYFSLIGGVATAVGSAALGVAFASTSQAMRWLPFAGLLLLGIIASALIVWMRRAGAFERS